MAEHNSSRAAESGRVGGRAAERPQLPRRFYTSVEVEQRDGSWYVLLDMRQLRSPGKHPVAVPSQALGAALADEWDAQGDVIDPAQMPLTRIINTALDGVADNINAVRDEIARFAGDDLVCYRAAHPEELSSRQQAAWDSPLTWLAETHGVELKTAVGIMPVAQSASDLQKFRRLLDVYDALQLAALHTVVTLMSSAVLGHAILAKRLSPEEAWAAAHLDEDWQIAQWGRDAEAEARRAFRWREFQAAMRIMDAL
ncbi:MAG: ATP12 family protein [Pseudomonadota bacterium]